MFVFNFKFKGKQLFKIVLIISFTLAISLFILAGYKIITQLISNEDIHNQFEIPSPEIAEISPENYTNILKEVHENIDTYVGQKISFTGYVYRVADLSENQFILARDMNIENMNQTIVVGFLSEYSDIKNFEDYTWIKVTGEIKKGYYYGDIPYLEITKIEKVQKPDNCIVPAPSETYVQTSVIY